MMDKFLRSAGILKKEFIQRPAMKLMGISVRTNNRIEEDPMEGKIFPCIQCYFHGNVAGQIPGRRNPGTTLCAYTDYESDHTGEYTYFIGEEVRSLDNVPEGLDTLEIPAQSYAKFTNGPGPMPDVIRDAWFAIWDMSEDELGGPRSYLTDFEVYDERASDHSRIVLDVCIGISTD